MYDGSGGNGHALAHFQGTGSRFPLCVKLGTITAAGGDVYSYAPDEDDMASVEGVARYFVPLYEVLPHPGRRSRTRTSARTSPASESTS